MLLKKKDVWVCYWNIEASSDTNRENFDEENSNEENSDQEKNVMVISSNSWNTHTT